MTEFQFRFNGHDGIARTDIPVRFESEAAGITSDDSSGVYLTIRGEYAFLPEEDALRMRDALVERYGLPSTQTTYGTAAPIEVIDAFLGFGSPEALDAYLEAVSEPAPIEESFFVIDGEGDVWVLNPDTGDVETGRYYLPESPWDETPEEASETLATIAEEYGGIDAPEPEPEPVSGPFPLGAVVRLADARGMSATDGALAVVTGYAAGFVLVEWLRYDPRWHGQKDGAYVPARFSRQF
jgi:hypothetical protein